MNTILGTHILYSICSACIYPEVKGQGQTVMKTVTVARSLVTRAATAVCCCCRRGSACRYDCLCLLVILVLLGRIAAVARCGLFLQTWSSVVCMCVCLSVGHVHEPCKSG